MNKEPHLVIDRVIISVGGERRELSLTDFLALPLHERVGVVLNRTAEFFHGRVPIDRKAALRSLRDLQTGS
jgi:hypothetical protein